MTDVCATSERLVCVNACVADLCEHGAETVRALVAVRSAYALLAQWLVCWLVNLEIGMPGRVRVPSRL